MSGGTFSLTNPGGFGTLFGTPIIPPPQVAILGVNAIVKRPVVVTDELGSDSIAIRQMMLLALSYDHRLVDGAYAAQFLALVKRHLETWDAAEYGVSSAGPGALRMQAAASWPCARRTRWPRRLPAAGDPVGEAVGVREARRAHARAKRSTS